MIYSETKFRKRNTIVVLLFLFQQGLLLPFSGFISIQVLMSIFSALLISYLIITNSIKININTIIIATIPLALLAFKLPFEPPIELEEESSVASRLFLGFLTMGLSGIMIGSLQISNQEFIRIGNKIAWMNFIFIGIIPFTSMYGFNQNTLVEYMRFGYAMLPTVLFSYYALLNSKSFSNLFLFILSILELIVFGARGSFASFLAFAALYFIFFSNLRRRWKISLSVALYIVFLSLSRLIGLMSYAMERLGVSTYSTEKYIALIEGEDLASTSSGRDMLYSIAWEKFMDSPIVGTPLNTCKEITGFDYYHNIFLDILANFGIFIFLFFCIFLIVKFYRAYCSNQKEIQATFLILFIIPFGRLLLSSSFWLRPEFWLYLSYSIHNIKKGGGQVHA